MGTAFGGDAGGGQGGKYQALPAGGADYLEEAEFYSPSSGEHLLLEVHDIERGFAKDGGFEGGAGGGGVGSLELVPYEGAKLQSLVGPGASEGVYRTRDLPKPHHVFREGLPPNPDVTIAVGPVLGRITDTTAVVLLEVSHPQGLVCACSINFAPVRGDAYVYAGATAGDNSAETWVADPPLAARDPETLTFDAKGSVTIRQTLESGRPQCLFASDLKPSTSYVVMVGGVDRSDIETRKICFRTLPSSLENLRLVAIAGHLPTTRQLGAANPWHRLGCLLGEGPEVVLTLHLGCTVDMVPKPA